MTLATWVPWPLPSTALWRTLRTALNSTASRDCPEVSWTRECHGQMPESSTAMVTPSPVMPWLWSRSDSDQGREVAIGRRGLGRLRIQADDLVVAAQANVVDDHAVAGAEGA